MTTPTEGAETMTRYRCIDCGRTATLPEVVHPYAWHESEHVRSFSPDCYGPIVREVAHVEWRPEPEMDRLDELAAVMRKGMFPEALDDWNECGPIIKKQWQSSAKAALRWLDEDAHRRFADDKLVGHDAILITQVLGFERSEYMDEDREAERP